MIGLKPGSEEGSRHLITRMYYGGRPARWKIEEEIRVQPVKQYERLQTYDLVFNWPA